MNIWQSLILGVVQGFTEFLPVSSSAHLVIVPRILGISSSVPFDVMLHLATFFAVVLYFWSDIVNMLKGFFGGSLSIISGKEKFIPLYQKDDHFKLSLLILAGSVPTALIGFKFEKLFESFFDSVFYVGCFLLVTAALILLAEWLGKPKKDMKKIGIWESLIVGVAQGFAVAPGISRSGATISTSLLCGMDRELAARFSFLLAIPAIFGAAAFKLKDVIGLGTGSIGWGVLAAGFLAALISGYIAIKLFMGMIQKMSIRIFAYYCLAVGGAIVILKIFF
jgi:undecaprenyl-diphosphatase